jgi:hypothetical protein
MATRLSDGKQFQVVSYSAFQNLYVAHNMGDKSGSMLLDPENHREHYVFMALDTHGFGLSYEQAENLRDHLDNMLAEYQTHKQERAERDRQQRINAYKAKLAEWEKGIKAKSISTSEAVLALMSGKAVRLLANVLGDTSGKAWEEYRVDSDGQVMCSTYSNSTPHLSSYGPLAKSSKDKRWVVLPFTARPSQPS